jgi:hypothetical protein
MILGYLLARTEEDFVTSQTWLCSLIFLTAYLCKLYSLMWNHYLQC